MRVKIGRKIYDTEKSTEVGKQTIGSFGDNDGFEEIMFQKSEQDFFLLVKGGPDSQYPEENIIPLELADAREWLGRVCGEDYAMKLIPTTEIKKTSKKRPVAKKSADKVAAPKKTTAKKSVAKTASAKAPAAKKTATKAKTAEKKTATPKSDPTKDTKGK